MKLTIYIFINNKRNLIYKTNTHMLLLYIYLIFNIHCPSIE